MGRTYDYLVKIDPNAAAWSGPRFLAGRPLSFDGDGYDEILAGFGGEIVNSIREGVRSSASVVVANNRVLPVVTGKLFSRYCLDDPIENIEVAILEKFRDEVTARTIFVGMVRKRDMSENTVVLELVELGLNREKVLTAKIDTASFPRARESDVGKDIPIPIGTVEDAELPVVADNAFVELAEEVDETATEIPVTEPPSAFPASGSVLVEEEVISYTGISPANPPTQPNALLTGATRGAASTVAKPHLNGALVVSRDTMDFGADSSGLDATVLAARAIDPSSGARVDLALPSMVTAGGRRLARYSETPTYLATSGPRDTVRIEADEVGGGSTAADAAFAAGDNPAFDGRNFALIGTTGSEILELRRAAAVPFRGKIERVLLTVMHSGNRGDDFELGTPSVFVNGVGVGALTSQDSFDDELQQLARGRNRGPVDVPVAPTLRQAAITLDVHRFGLDGGGAGPNPDTRFNTLASGWITAADAARLNDGDQNPPPGRMLGDGSPANRGRNEFQVTVGGIPDDITQTDSLQKVRLVCVHGGDTEAGPFPAGQTGNYLLEIEEPPFFAPGDPTPNVQVTSGLLPISSTVKVEKLEWDVSAMAKTVADLAGMQFTVTLLNFVPDTAIRYATYEVYLEIEYLSSDPVRDAGSIQTDIPLDIQAVKIADWDDLQLAEIRIEGDGTNSFAVYHALFNVIHTPQAFRFPSRILFDIQAAPELTGTPAELISALWTEASLGGNAAGTIDAASVTAASTSQDAAGYTAANIGGLIRGLKLMDAVSQLALETRLRAYVFLGVLRLSYIEDLASLPAVSRTLTKDDVKGPIRVRGSDIERDLSNRISTRFAFTDFDGFRKGLELTDAPSIAAFGDFRANLDLAFVQDIVPATATAASLLERRKAPFDRLALDVGLELRNDVGLEELLALDFGDWFDAARFEVDTIAELLDHRIRLSGRTLP